MDRKTLLGFLLMGGVMMLFMYLNQPSAEELERMRKERQEQLAAQDEARRVQASDLIIDTLSPTEVAMIAPAVRQYGVVGASDGTYRLETKKVALESDGTTVSGTVNAMDTTVDVKDILANKLSGYVPRVASEAVKNLRSTLSDISRYKEFARYLSGDSSTISLENDVLSLNFSNKGGRIVRAELKDYDCYRNNDTTKVVLFEGETNTYSFVLSSANQRFETSDFYFEPVQESDSTVMMKLDLGNGSSWGIRYTLLPGSYLVKMDVVQTGMDKIIPSSVSTMDFHWYQKMKRNEEGRMFEERNSAIYYKLLGDEVEDLNVAGDESEEVNQKLKWIGYKNQFFSSVIIPDTQFENARMVSKELKSDADYLKTMVTDAQVEYSSVDDNVASFNFFFGPNLYPLLSSYDEMISPDEDLELTRLIPLGWSLFRWINTLIVIPVFTFLGSFISDYGIIILLLTLFIKLILFPFTYKSYMSQAKMRVLAPEIKEINDKYPGNENAMVRQQKTMALYSRAGASPFSGCLPMLLQMPILIAMFTFFPSCIELRGEPFLWAHDLSAPDVIISWDAHIPFVSDYFGNHISLFCLLMTVTNILYTRITMQNQGGSASMPGMKWMMYLMPVMFLVFFNNYASGLSYYYFLSLLITIVQTYVFRHFVVDENKVRQAMLENAKKPKKKSGFMARLEEAQRKQQAMMREQEKQRKKR